MLKKLLACLIFFPACSNHSSDTSITKSTTGRFIVAQPPFTCNYDAQKIRCRDIFKEYLKHRSDNSEKKLVNYITDSLLSCWYGTPWDFNGTTELPGDGNIACGYFVTTVLRDAGYSIDRIKMAQCASEQLVKSTCTSITRYRNKTLEDFVNAVKQQDYGLYIVGLDNHTGFILNDDHDVYFIHSGVYAPKCALKERAIESPTLRNSTYRVLGRIVFK